MNFLHAGAILTDVVVAAAGRVDETTKGMSRLNSGLMSSSIKCFRPKEISFEIESVAHLKGPDGNVQKKNIKLDGSPKHQDPRYSHH